jgi:MFS family permease
MPRPRGLLLDTRPIRENRGFRLLWVGQLANNLGRQAVLVTLPYHVFSLTHSIGSISLLAAVTLLGLLLFALPAGSVADARDRRSVLVATQTGLIIAAAALVFLTSMKDAGLPYVYLAAFAVAAISVIDRPARRSAVPTLVPTEQITGAVVLDQATNQVATVVGPALGGLLIASLGVAAGYILAAAAFSFSLIAVWAMPSIRVPSSGPHAGMHSVWEGVRFIVRTPAVLATYLVDLAAMIFGLPTALFPIIALTTMHGDATTFGLLTAAPGVGALVASLTTGWVRRVTRQGRAVVAAVGVWGSAVAILGLVLWSLPLALLCLVVAGAADIISAVFRTAILQLAAPDALRGRLMAVQVLVVGGGPRLGDLEATAVAAVAGAPFSVLSGGLLCLVGLGVIVWRFPQFLAIELLAAPANDA